MTAFRLAMLELRRFTGHPLRRAVLAGLLMVPLLVGALHLWSTWDPYGESEHVPVAVVNEDRGADVNGRRIDVGAEFTAQLATTRTFEWHFVSSETAASGIDRGDYYFAIVVPADLSEKLAGLFGTDPRRAHIALNLNDANGYLATVMAKSARAELQNQIDTAAYVTLAKSMIGDLTGLDDELTDSAVNMTHLAGDAARVSDRAADVNTGLIDLEAASGEMVRSIEQLGGAVPSVGSRGAGRWSDIQSGTQNVADLTDGFSRRLDDAYAALCAETTGTEGCDDLQAAMSDAEEITGSAADVNAAVQDLSHDDFSSIEDRMRELTEMAELVSLGVGDVAEDAGEVSGWATELADDTNDAATRLEGAALAVPSAEPAANASATALFASPVDIEESNAHPAGMYGRALSPLFFGIALWIFGMIAYMVIRPVNPRALAGRISAFTVAVAGWLPALVLGVVGAVVLFCVVDVALGLNAAYPVTGIGVVITGVFAFTALAHLLRFAFGVVGDVAMSVALMLQLTAAGGMYPVETAPWFFQALNPLMPMTYFVDAMRIAISGGDVTRVWWNVTVLAVFGLVAIAASVLVARHRRQWTVWRLDAAARG